MARLDGVLSNLIWLKKMLVAGGVPSNPNHLWWLRNTRHRGHLSADVRKSEKHPDNPSQHFQPNTSIPTQMIFLLVSYNHPPHSKPGHMKHLNLQTWVFKRKHKTVIRNVAVCSPIKSSFTPTNVRLGTARPHQSLCTMRWLLTWRQSPSGPVPPNFRRGDGHTVFREDFVTLFYCS